MSEKVILKIDTSHSTLSLYESMLKIELKGSIKDEIEDALENKPVLKQTIGGILNIFAPLHIRLCDIDSVQTDGTGKVKIILRRHRDVGISLQPNEATKLVNKLNALIPEAKRNELLRIMREEKLQRIAEEQLELGRGSGVQVGSGTIAAELGEEIAEAEEREEQKKED